MQGLTEFTGAQGGTQSGAIRWEPYLEKEIQEYIEIMSPMRPYCSIYRLNGTYTANLPKSYSTGMAVEIVEGMEIPTVRQVLGTVDIKVSANGTAIEMTDEAKKLDWYGDLAQREIREMSKRMLRKENNDITTTMLGGTGTGTDSVDDDIFQFEDVVDAKTYLRKEYGYQADTIFANPNQVADLIKSDKFRDLSKSGSTAPLRQGEVGGQVAGLNIVELPEMPHRSVIVGAMNEDPLWLVVLQDLQMESWRDYDRRMDKVAVTCYQKPAVLKPEAMRLITITEA